jgi:hypothetical protein
MSEQDKTVKVTKDDSTIVYKETAVDVKEDTSTHVMINKDEDLRTKAERASDAVTDLIDSSIDRAANAVRSKVNELRKSGAFEPGYFAARKDSADIGRLGPLVTGLATAFEDTITMVRQHPYDEQEKILTGYKKLMEEQINVINSRIQFVKRIPKK